MAVDFGPWRCVYPRFDFSPSGKSGGKEKEAERERFTASPGAGTVSQDCPNSSGCEKEASTLPPAYFLPATRAELRPATPTEATPPTPASQVTPITRNGSAHSVFRVYSLRRLFAVSTSVRRFPSQLRNSCCSNPAFHVTFVTPMPSDGSRKWGRDQT